MKPRRGLREIVAALKIFSRDDVVRFERAFAAAMGARFAVAFPYGRTALQMTLEALALKDREVITPAYTCAVVQHAVVYSGNKPVFVDCQTQDYNMDLSLVAERINERSGALVATSIFGYPVDLDALDKIRREFKIPIIQDCCHSLAAEWDGRPVQREGLVAIYGLNVSKVMNSIFGGMITTDDAEFYRKIKGLRDTRLKSAGLGKSLRRFLYLLAIYPAFQETIYGFVNWLERKKLLDRFTMPMNDAIITMPSDYLTTMTPLEARVGLANLSRYDELIRDRREAAEFYFAQMRRPEFKLPPKVEGATYSHFPVEVQDRAHWLGEALKRGLQLGEIIEYSVPEMSSYGQHAPAEFPVSARYSRHTINLPIWGGAKLARRVVAILNSVP